MAHSLTGFQVRALLEFISTAKANGLRIDAAKLPQRHPMIWSGGVDQIRGNRALAEAWDELGNLIVLTIDGTTLQLCTEAEVKAHFRRKR